MHPVVESLIAAPAIGGTLIFSPILRPWYTRWGATPDEVSRALPGDDLIPTAQLVSTRALTIHAEPTAVWPWLVQIGQGRGGMYSYDALENLAGCQIHSVDRIVPEYQTLAVGDRIRFGPDGYPFNTVYQIEPERYVLMHDNMDMADANHEVKVGDPLPENYTQSSWLFYLEPIAEGTRLISRWRIGYSPKFSNKLIWRVLTEPIAFVMERKMLLGIRQRVEHH